MTRSDSSGWFVLRDVAPGRLLSAQADGFAPADTQAVPDTAESPVAVEFVLSPAPGVLEGVVYDPDGQPLSDAPVQVGSWRPIAVAPGAIPRYSPVRDTRTDARDRFRFRGLGPGPSEVWARGAGSSPWHEHVEVPADRPEHVVIRLQRGATVHGTVRDREGAASAGAKLYALHDRFFAGPPWARIGARSDAEGRYELAHVQPGRALVRVEGDAGLALAAFDLVEAERRAWHPVLGEGLVIEGTVQDEQGRGLPGFRIFAR